MHETPMNAQAYKFAATAAMQTKLPLERKHCLKGLLGSGVVKNGLYNTASACFGPVVVNKGCAGTNRDHS